MPVPVLSFHLSILMPSGAVSHGFGDLVSIQEEWERRRHDGAMGVLHAGFHHVDLRNEKIGAARRGRMFLTSAASSALRDISVVEALPCDHIAGQPVYKWSMQMGRDDGGDGRSNGSGWIAAALDQHVDLAQAFGRAGIHGDEDYGRLEAGMPAALRTKAGQLRFRAMGGRSRLTKLPDLLRACPPWVLAKPLEDISLTTRLSNIFIREGLLTVRDLSGRSEDAVKSYAGMGITSIADLRMALVAAVDRGVPETAKGAGQAASFFLQPHVPSSYRAPRLRKPSSVCASISYHLTMIELDGGSEVFSSDYLDDIQGLWLSQDRGSTMGVLHVGVAPIGLERHLPDAGSTGRISLTPAAMHVLGTTSQVLSQSYCRIGDVPLHRWLVEWNREGGATDDLLWSRQSIGWVEQLRIDHPAIAGKLFDISIFNDEEYMLHEKHLDAETRTIVGQYRFDAFKATAPSADIFHVLHSSPPWLLDRSVFELPLTKRLTTVFTNVGIRKVRDLLVHSDASLGELKNFGRTSLRDLRGAIQAGISLGAPVAVPVSELIDLTSSPKPMNERIKALRPFIDQFLVSLEEVLDDRKRRVLQSRMGWMGPSSSLQEIAVAMKVSRERVRQIEAKALQHLRQRCTWPSQLVEIVQEEARKRPIAIDYLLELPWFDGARDLRGSLGYLVDAFGEGSLHWYPLEVDDEPVFMRVPRSDWLTMSKNALAAMKQHVGSARSVCEGTVREIAVIHPELAGELWSHTELRCRFATVDGVEVMVHVGGGIDAVVAEIMAGAQYPLHVREIQAIAGEEHGHFAEEATIQGIVAQQAVQLGVGVYGRPDHVGIADEDRLQVVALAEGAMLGHPGRQWHTDELLDEVGAVMPELRLNRQVLEWLLLESGTASLLGRHSWSCKATARHDHVSVQDAVVNALNEAGGPLFTNELIEMVRMKRGLGPHIQFATRSPVVRMGKGLYGLRDRDLAIPLELQDGILDVMHRKLLAKGEVISAEGWANVAGLKRYPGEDLVALASLDNRFRTGGDKVGLFEWDALRRRWNVGTRRRVGA